MIINITNTQIITAAPEATVANKPPRIGTVGTDEDDDDGGGGGDDDGSGAGDGESVEYTNYYIPIEGKR